MYILYSIIVLWYGILYISVYFRDATNQSLDKVKEKFLRVSWTH